MKSFDSLVIPFKGLKLGTHRYDLRIGPSFFARFEYGEIREGDLKVHIDLDKAERMLVFRFSISGEVIVPCDRCNEPVRLPVHGEERLIVKFGEEFSEQSEEVQVIPESETHFDTAPYLYEYVHLLLPLRRIHPENEPDNNACSPDMLARLNELLRKRTPDPRWEQLKDLKDKS